MTEFSLLTALLAGLLGGVHCVGAPEDGRSGEGVLVSLAPALTDLPIIVATVYILSGISGSDLILGIISLAGTFFVGYSWIQKHHYAGHEVPRPTRKTTVYPERGDYQFPESPSVSLLDDDRSSYCAESLPGKPFFRGVIHGRILSAPYRIKDSHCAHC